MNAGQTARHARLGSTELDDVSDVELKELQYPDDLEEPPVFVPKDDELPKLRVELKFCIDEISSIDTLNGTVAAKVWIGLAWNDPRLRGETEFPENCWMPCVVLKNSAGTDFVYKPQPTKITDSESGQCYRLFYGEGNFACAMDLHEYPFDSQKLSFVIRTISMHAVNSKLKSNPVRFEDYGSMAKRVYPEDPNPRVLYFDDDFDYKQALVEWTIQSLTLTNNNQIDQRTNGVDDAHLMTVEVVVQREFTYYLNTMVMVLVMLSSFTLSVVKMHPCDKYSERMSFVMTVFLAIVAFAFVMASSTPSTPYLTVIDKLTSASYALTFFVGLETVVFALVAEFIGAEEEGAFELIDKVQLWDRVTVLVLVGLNAWYYIKVVGSRVAGNLNIRDADRKALDIAVEPKFLSRRPLVSLSV